MDAAHTDARQGDGPGRSDALSMVLGAGDTASMHFPRYAIEGVDWSWRHLRGLSLALAARARLAAGEGKVSEAMLYLRHVRQMSAALSDQGDFYVFVGSPCRADALHVLRLLTCNP